jgi:hypothetical protein
MLKSGHHVARVEVEMPAVSVGIPDMWIGDVSVLVIVKHGSSHKEERWSRDNDPIGVKQVGL